MQFVQVHKASHQFTLNGQPFYFAGANCYYLLTRAADPAQHSLVKCVLNAAVQLGVSVLRTWAFNDGPEQYMSMQPRPGEHTEAVLQGLDWLLLAASRRGLRLMLCLINNWHDFGGVQQYVKWAFPHMDTACHKDTATDIFVSSPACKAMYLTHCEAVMRRRSSLTGLRYAEDPTVFAWELFNEPRMSCGAQRAALVSWTRSVSAHVKRLAPQQLLTVGSEGFWGPSTPGMLAANPYQSAIDHGCDFLEEHSDPNIDFASIHMYPVQWCRGEACDPRVTSFTSTWIRGHADVCARQLHKPLVLTEFGLQHPSATSSNVSRPGWVHEVLRECHAAGAGSSGPLAGAMLWMLAAPEYPDYDGFTLHVTPQALHHAQQAAYVLCASLSSSMPGSSSAHAGAAAVGLAHHYHAHHAPMGFGGTDATKPDEDAQCLMQLAQYAVYCRLGSGRRGTGVSSGSGLQGTMPNTHELHPASAASCHAAMHIQQPHVPAAWAGPHATHAQGYGHGSDAAGSGCGSLVHAVLQWLNDRR